MSTHAGAPDHPNASPKPLARRIAGLLAAPAVLFFFDAFVMNQGAVAALAAFVAVAVGLPMALYQAVAKRNREAAVRHALRALFFTLASVAVFTVNGAQNDMARRRAGVVIAACDAFYERHARYPSTLDELVPEFLPGVPRAKYTLGFSEFTYMLPPNGSPTLFYVTLPPFGRPTYSFARHAWGFVD